MMKFYVLTLFPKMIEGFVSESIIGRAKENNIVDVECINIRDFTENKHKKVDDYPYGGGAGMVMQAPPVYNAYESLQKDKKVRVVFVTPSGKTFTQNMAKEFASQEELIILCGHYEGVDERVLEEIVTDEISIGDYVLTGGEIPACVLIDAIARLIPGVLNKEESFENESFENNLLEYPQYTRPPVFMGREVPEVLLSGHHKNVAKWRLEKSLEKTKRVRPDMLDAKL
ncbi:MAG TPA: tRNA (guanosine(37)-N1)-methyltransferase TrmD [Clostridiales bacterium]|nr:MAG: tRNA (guanosine(37)-N1)-methyltransferase TrmD [Clostridiales bacterium GWD2_32_19]HCC07547.1 tRNA (guanosine(37)-N1)-methyltransferase TrmD [Clostridiales bacterium]